MKLKRRQIGLALGGGGARGLCHIGVLKVFEQEGIPINIIAGTSVGALVGGAYACGISADELARKVHDYINTPEFKSSAIKTLSDMYGGKQEDLTQKIQSFFKNQFYLIQMLFKPGILSTGDFQSMIDYFVPDVFIQDTTIPFRAVATDLITGDQVVFSEGSLRQAVTASCAVPGVIEPVIDGKRLLSDGGIISMTPVSIVKREGADIVIAVTVDRDMQTDDELKTVKDIYYRASEITSIKLEMYELLKADIVIRPSVKNLHWTEFSQAIDLIKEGEKAARDMVPGIRDKMSFFKIWINSIKKLVTVRN